MSAPHTKFSAEAVATIRALRAKGHSIREVVQLTGTSVGSVQRYSAGIALPFGPVRCGPKKKVPFNVCKALRDQGLTYRQISERLGCSYTAVYWTLKTKKSRA